MTNQIGVTGIRSDEINAKTFTTVVIGNTESYEFIPNSVKIEPVEADGVIVSAVVSIGTNSPNYNNIVAACAIPSGLSIDELLVNAIKVPEDTDIVVKATTNSTATGNHKFRVVMSGEYIP